MTEPTDLPTGAHDAQDDAADARWFRSAVAPVVDTRPVPDAWDDIRARATGESPPVVRLAPASGPGRLGTRRRLALAAATVIVVAGIGGAAVLTRDDDGDRETITAAPPTAEGTGWYVPEELPEGWQLESVSTDWMDVEGLYEACPCDTTVWASEDGTQSVAVIGLKDTSYVADSLNETDVADTEGETVDNYVSMVELPGGIPARVNRFQDFVSVEWVDGDQAWNLVSETLDPDAMVLAADRVEDDAASSPVDGFQLLYRSSDTPGAARAFHSVSVRLQHADRGVSLSYTLQPFEADRSSIYLAGAAEELDPVSDEQPLFASRVGPRPERPTGYNEIFIGAQWPGAWIMAGLGDSELSEGPATEADVDTLLRSLRPATGDEWRAFLDTATGTVDDGARVDRLGDLIVYDGDVDPGSQEGSSSTESPETAEPNDDEHAEVQTTTPDVAMTAALEVAERFATLAPQIVDGSATIPDDMFAASVDLGLGSEVIRQVAAPNLVDPNAWVIDGDDVELHAGRVPPFSALDLIHDVRDYSVLVGYTAMCPADRALPTPPADDVGLLLTITPMEIDSCIDWFAVSLVLDEQQRITGVHLYLAEP